jgi:hypothetical protein
MKEAGYEWDAVKKELKKIEQKPAEWSKEVDSDYIKDELDKAIKIYKPSGDFGWGTLYNVATHFFELGLKAQKGE